ncbi:alpha/beta hydrolase [Streptomyces sp. RS10V-4]|uniref:alpha/beta fold hydrolase n=1 Tax=Streptomyces rhizoryzae TaxID=2932493 RepID=UPI0020052611|nr:alpha/beta hydrolase [Streptomyces rhizoryzae]MCK7623508.1 alpha/beta hydrolase [Streptomyces rhizoryzae]
MSRAPGDRRVPGRRVAVGGAVLHVVTEGRGPVVVLSGGLGMAWSAWDAVAARLAPHRTVVRFDRPGLGLSGGVPGGPAGLAAEADRIAGLLDALGHRAPATVVGHSLAAFHAEAFARLHPGRCAGLVLADGSVEEDPRPRLPRAVRAAWARGAAGALRAAGLPHLLGPAAHRLLFRAGTVTRPPRPAPGAAAYRTARVLRACLLEHAGYPYQAADLAALRRARPLPAVPVTVLAADDGRGTRGGRRWLARQRALAAALGARCTVAAPAGHLVMADAPDAVARAVLDQPGPR